MTVRASGGPCAGKRGEGGFEEGGGGPAQEALYAAIGSLRSRGAGRLDPRAKIYLLLLVGVGSYFISGALAGTVFMVALFALCCLGGGLGRAGKALVFYVLVVCLTRAPLAMSAPFLGFVIGLFGVMLLKVVPTVMLGRWVYDTTDMDDLMLALQRAKASRAFTIPLLVAFRYIPTLALEYRAIREAIVSRGVFDSWTRAARRPLLAVECLFVPLLARSLKLADELSASGVTRGLGLDVENHSLHELSFGPADALVCAGASAFVLALMLADKAGVGDLAILGRLG